MPKLIDLTGQRFERLTVIERADNRYGEAFWRCKCECGNTAIVAGKELRRNRTNSCGCLRIGQLTHRATRQYKQTSDYRLYAIWANMKDRCYRVKNPAYQRYGGAGIAVCDEWQEFEPFMKWALANGYRKNLTIDRIDGSKNYSPENCRWATRLQQTQNRKNTRWLTYMGQTKTIKEWALDLNIPYDLLRHRIQNGWSTTRALTEPIHIEQQRYKQK